MEWFTLSSLKALKMKIAELVSCRNSHALIICSPSPVLLEILCCVATGWDQYVALMS